MPSTTKMRSRPQVYPPISFHTIRAIAFISAVVVSGILIYFCVQLRHDGFKLPWTFIIVLASTLLSLITLLLTTLLYTCFFLSPLFSLVLNSTVLLLYIVGYGLLTWNLYGTLGHSCSRANWATDDGMMICRTYKAFYSFEVFGLLAQVGLIVLDIRSRRIQTRSGKYNRMGEGAVKDVKLDDLPTTTRGGMNNTTDPHGHGHANSADSLPYGIESYNDSRARLRDNAADYAHVAPPVRMQDFRNDSAMSGMSGVSSYDPRTGYGNGGYGYGPQR